MHRLYDRIASGYYAVATAFLLVLSVVLLLAAVWESLVALFHADIIGVLEGVGLVIVGFAIMETAKFIAEEEILRDKELRSAVESRRSLTKFISIIVIATSLEALVMVFETARTDVADSLYAALLFAAAMFALIALGVFQWLSSRIAPPPEGADASIDHSQPPADELSGDDEPAGAASPHPPPAR